MTSRGLPGFLRRTRRNDFEEHSDNENGDANADNDTDEDDKGSKDNRNNHHMNNDPLPIGLAATVAVTVIATATAIPTVEEPKTETVINGGGGGAPTHAPLPVLVASSLDPSPREQPFGDDDSSSSTSPTPSHPESQSSHSSTLSSDVSVLGASSTSSLPLGGSPAAAGGTTTAATSSGGKKKISYRETQFSKILNVAVVKLPELRKLGWNGIPPESRAMVWKLLLGYLPTNQSRRKQTLERKRAEYKDAIAQHYEIDDNSRTLQEQETLRQVLVDVPRTAPEITLFRNERIKRALARLLYIWAMRHPASSYVQGINDLATPLFAVFLSEYYNGEDVLENGNVMVVISEERLQEVEADVYWCLTSILAGIQDHYTADQPGVQRMVMRLEELVQRIDANLCRHLESVGIHFMQFAFKWMNCLLLREFNLKCVIRLWDTYISEETAGFEDFHVYVCAAFLCQFSAQLQSMGFDDLFGFMQQVPTDDWEETEIEMLLSQAYVLSTLFGGSEAHLKSANQHRNSTNSNSSFL